MMPDEVRKMDNKKCLIFIRGFDPILDGKYVPFKHPMFLQTADGDGEAYVHSVSENGVAAEPAFSFLNPDALKYYEDLQEKGEAVYIDKLDYEEFKLLGQEDIQKRFMELDEEKQREKFLEEEQPELTYENDVYEDQVEMKTEQKSMDTVFYRMMHMPFTKEQKAEVKRAMDVKVPMEIILSYFYPETPVTQMMEYRRKYEN